MSRERAWGCAGGDGCGREGLGGEALASILPGEKLQVRHTRTAQLGPLRPLFRKETARERRRAAQHLCGISQPHHSLVGPAPRTEEETEGANPLKASAVRLHGAQQSAAQAPTSETSSPRLTGPEPHGRASPSERREGCPEAAWLGGLHGGLASMTVHPSLRR